MYKNDKEFRALAERYASITLEEIEEVFDNYSEARGDITSEGLEHIKGDLTGFGSLYTCTLCEAVKQKESLPDCSQCVWVHLSKMSEEEYPCFSALTKESYNLIEAADEPELLLIAYKDRAKVMEDVLDMLDNVK